jgi:hypothetical protein
VRRSIILRHHLLFGETILSQQDIFVVIQLITAAQDASASPPIITACQPQSRMQLHMQLACEPLIAAQH